MSFRIYKDLFKNPKFLLLGIFLLSVIPFLLVELFHSTLYMVMDIPSYLVFHNVAEFFSVMVSFSIFGVGWYTHSQSKEHHTLFLSSAFLVIGLLDFMHMLGYSGMPALITPNTPNKSTQFWVVVRFITGLSFLVSAFIYPEKPIKWVSKELLILAALGLSLSIFIAITFFPSHVPLTFQEGIGLTPFKKISEYIIISLLLSAFFAYWRRMSKTGEGLILYYLAAFILCIFSELVFAVYESVFDTYNVLGHIYKIFAFYLIYKGVFVAAVNKPYKEIIKTNEHLQAEIIKRQQAGEKILQSLHEKETLVREIHHRTKNTIQVIRGMLLLQANEFESNHELQEVIKKVDDRILAISLVHKMLYATQNLSQISIKEYMEELSHLILESYRDIVQRITLDVQVEENYFLLDTAIPLGLILTELMTNSLKHAFPNNREGKISISFTKNESKKNVFYYSYNGVVLQDGFDFRNQNTLGMKLIYSIGEGQMQGKVLLENRSGLYCAIEFPNNLYKPRI